MRPGPLVPEPGYADPDGASIIDPGGVAPAIGFLRVPEPKTAKNRMHIDIRVAGEPLDHVVMLDPEGNEFCVA